MRSIAAKDERGRSWMIYENDLAWSHCYRLQRMGLAEIVLPTEVFLKGTCPDLAEVMSLGGVPIEAVAVPAVANMVKQLVRLRDCVYALRDPTGDN